MAIETSGAAGHRPFYFRLREWIASSPRKPANIAFTSGDLRDAAYAVEDSGLLSSSERVAELEARVRELESVLREVDEAVYMDDHGNTYVSDEAVLGRVRAALSAKGTSPDA